MRVSPLYSKVSMLIGSVPENLIDTTNGDLPFSGRSLSSEVQRDVITVCVHCLIRSTHSNDLNLFPRLFSTSPTRTYTPFPATLGQRRLGMPFTGHMGHMLRRIRRLVKISMIMDLFPFPFCHLLSVYHCLFHMRPSACAYVFAARPLYR